MDAPLVAVNCAAWPPPLPATSASDPLLAPHPLSEPEPEPSNVPFEIRFVAASAADPEMPTAATSADTTMMVSTQPLRAFVAMRMT